MIEDAKKLVRLMGAPIVESPSEAEAQCSEIVKLDLAFATASEDMDSLTFGSNFLLRGFNSKKEPITQIELAQILDGFEMNMDEFIDLCILCGCDYTKSIAGVGPVKAFKFISDERNLENVLEKVKKLNEDPDKKTRYIIPDNFLFVESRKMFKEPEVIRDKAEIEALLKWNKPDEQGIRDFLVGQKAFMENKVENGLKKLGSCQTKVNQSRLDCFFKSAGVS